MLENLNHFLRRVSRRPGIHSFKKLLLGCRQFRRRRHSFRGKLNTMRMKLCIGDHFSYNSLFGLVLVELLRLGVTSSTEGRLLL